MIDACTSTFADLATVVLPCYMVRLRAAMKKPLSLTEFCISGVGVKTILRQHLQRTSDFSGCYVLLRDGNPLYVGISRGVVGRLRQHGTGKTHYDASLAYRMAFKKAPHKTTRNEAMKKNSSFLRAFHKAQRLLHGSSVAFIEISNPLELYLFEAYCAMKLDTSEWNTFRTH
jgi:predicted GIY-YIG superfamily endonuclease